MVNLQEVFRVTPVPARSLLAYLAAVPDPRQAQGRRHSAAAMLAAIVCAVLCGARGYAAIAQWIAAQDVSLWHALGFCRKPPTRNAFRDFLKAVSTDALEHALRRWMQEALSVTIDPPALAAVALDGKSLCGTLAAHDRSVHLLSLLDHATGCVLSPRAMDPVSNEYKAGLQLLQTLVLTGRLVTADALFCQREMCQQILDSGGHYLVVVKDNQPTLKEALAAEFQAGFSPLQRAAAPGAVA